MSADDVACSSKRQDRFQDQSDGFDEARPINIRKNDSELSFTLHCCCR